jgi:undecaprenyl-diphosphatase
MTNLNQYLFQLIYQFSRRNSLLDYLGVFLSQYLAYILVLGFLIFIFYKRDWRLRFFIFADGAIAVILARGIITELIRFFYHSPRPFDVLNFAPLIGESGYSFPSGHAAWFFALAMIVYYFNRRLGIWYFVFAAIMGIARIFVGVHWPLDILGGAAVGLLSAFLVHKLLKPSLDKISLQEHNLQ